MNHSLTRSIFNEELYSVSPRPIVVLANSWNNFTSEEKSLLEKILGLAAITLNNVTIVSSDKLDILQWPDKPNVVIAFGLDIPGLPKNEIIEVQGSKVIITSALTAVANLEKEAKQKLARALSELF